MPNNPFQNLPQGWEVKTLGEIFLIERGGSPRPIKEYLTTDSDGINWIKIGDTKNITKYISETAQKIKPEGKKYSRFVEIGDLILSNSMSFGKPYIMKTTGCIHDGWVVFKQSKKIVDEEFCYYVLSSSELYAQFDKLATGSTVKNLNIERIKQIQIPLPPLETQQKIVAKLESEFAKIASAKSHLEKVKETIPRLKNALLKSAFIGELTCQKMSDSASAIEIAPPNTESNTQTPTFPQTPNIGGATLVAQNLQDRTNPPNCHFEHSEESQKHSANAQYDKKDTLPQGWEVKTLGEVSKINPKNKLDDDLEVSFIPMNLVADKYQNKFSYTIKTWKEVKKGYTHLQNNCIVIAKITPCFENGKCVILQGLKNGYGAGTTELIVILPNENIILLKFIFYFFSTTKFTKEGIKSFKGTAGQLRVSSDFISKLPIPLPPLQTQKQIVEILDSKFAALENLEKETNASLEKLQKLKSSLLNQAFKGELIC